MDGDSYLIADFDPRQIHQGGVKDDAVGISHLRNCFRHDVILCFTRFIGKKKYLRVLRDNGTTGRQDRVNSERIREHAAKR